MEIGRKIGEGATAEIFEFGDDRVLKLFRRGFPEAQVGRELQRAQAVNACGVSAPKVYGRTEWDGRDGVIYERVRGASMLHQIRPWNVRKYARLLARLHCDLHRVRPEGLPSFREQLLRGIRAASGLTEEEKDAVSALLSKLPDGAALCHGDFHPDNVLLTNSGPVILDWMTAAVGDPQADVARTCLMLRTSELPGDMPDAVRRFLGFLRKRLLSCYLAEYRACSGTACDSLEKWMVPLVAARLNENRPEGEQRLLLEIVRAGLRYDAESRTAAL